MGTIPPVPLRTPKDRQWARATCAAAVPGPIDPGSAAPPIEAGTARAIAATGWAGYILLTQVVGDRFSGIDGLAITIPIAALATTFIGLPQAWGNITPWVVVQAIGLALLLPVIPFTLELQALRRLTTAAFGTLMALEPAVATMWGVVLLAQIPQAAQFLGVVLVVIAGIGAERSGRRTPIPATPMA